MRERGVGVGVGLAFGGEVVGLDFEGVAWSGSAAERDGHSPRVRRLEGLFYAVTSG